MTDQIGCPLCGHTFKNYFVKEIKGWIECEHCKKVVYISHTAGDKESIKGSGSIFPADFFNNR